MIAAMTLCAHLVALKAATHCSPVPHTGTSSVTSAAFDTPDGGRGTVEAYDDAAWDWLTNPPIHTAIEARDTPVREERIRALLGTDGATVLTAYAAHIVVVLTTHAVQDRVSWWVGIVSDQAQNLANERALKEDIVDERANPTGVVDLAYLHGAGEDLLITQKRLAANAAEYKRTTGMAMLAGL